MHDTEMKHVFKRIEQNPLITAEDIPYLANTVFNAGAIQFENEVLLLLRVESASGRSHLIVARSEDGITNWRVGDRALLHPEDNFPYESNGCEDCRITWMEDLGAYVLVYTAYSDQGPGIAIATTQDFKTVARLGLMFPPNDKNGALLPAKFDGQYAILHRPSVGGGSIWLSYSEDLVYWGKSQLVVPVRKGPWWDGQRVGAGLPPVLTDEGWLLMYHGVKDLAGRPIYRMGAALLDRERPSVLRARARRWLLGPETQYERTGDAPNVIFACGGFIRDGMLWLYYGAADSSICLARANINDVLRVVKTETVEPGG